MNVAVVDVGSNTIRLLVAARGRDGVECVARGKRMVGLGADVERRGTISAAKLTEASECVAAFAAEARAAGAVFLDVVVASPGRQAENAAQLVAGLSRAAGVQARVLTRDEEAALAFDGALAAADYSGAVAVCDVGGGSTQVAVGTASGGPAWLRSVDLGSLRLSSRIPVGDPPAKGDIAALRAEARSALEHLTPPLPSAAVAVGGTARALRKVVGRALGEGELKEALRVLRKEPAKTVATRYRIDPWRARALPAGTAVLVELQALLAVPLEVGRGGLREGAALELARRAPRGSGRRQVTLRPDVRGAGFDDPDASLLRRPRAEQRVQHVAVRRERGQRPGEPGEERQHPACGRALRQLVSLLDLEAEHGRRRLERLHAAHVWARDEPVGGQVREGAGERLGLALALAVERAKAVVAGPLVALAGPGVADEQGAHQQPASEPRTSRSRS